MRAFFVEGGLADNKTILMWMRAMHTTQCIESAHAHYEERA